MLKRCIKILFTGLFFLALLSCGGARYSQVTPEGKNYHPKRIGVLPADVGPWEEARGVVDQVIAGRLAKKGWYSDIVAGDTMGRVLAANDVLRRDVMDYILKLKTVNYSDPMLSRSIGEKARVDAFLVVYVDPWTYTREGTDKVAKVGLSMTMVDGVSGHVVWKGSHSKSEDYLLVRPDLDAVAGDVMDDLIEEMPH